MINIKQNRRGFTLVELLVVVAIIAILSTIGLTLFNGAQQNARDARRKSDIDAIASALESKRLPGTPFYSPIVAADFSSGVIPVDTISTQVYCIRLYTDDTTIKTEALPSATFGGTGASAGCPADAAAGTSTVWYPATVAGGFAPISGTAAVPFSDSASPYAANKKSWKLCAKLENTTSAAAAGYAVGTYCKYSAQ